MQRLNEDGWNIVATVRNPQQPGALADVPGVRIEQLEMNDTAQLDGLKQRLQGQVFDLVFVNAGVMGPCRKTWRRFRTRTSATCS